MGPRFRGDDTNQTHDMTVATTSQIHRAPRAFLRRSHLFATLFVTLLAAAVLAPLISLATIALTGDAETVCEHTGQRYVLKDGRCQAVA